ncbi:MAG: DNA translocase FtsK [Anaeroplasmataceae bacterium]
MKKKILSNKPESYRIPQIDVAYEGLKKSRDSYKKTVIGSPLFGSAVKDTILVNDISKVTDIDVRQTYDSFRDKNEKKITDEEIIAKHGTKYYEFDIINEETRKAVYGDDITPLKRRDLENQTHNKVTGTTDFTFIKTKEELLNQNKSEPADVKHVEFEQIPADTFDNTDNINVLEEELKPTLVEHDIDKLPENIFRKDLSHSTIVRKSETTVDKNNEESKILVNIERNYYEEPSYEKEENKLEQVIENSNNSNQFANDNVDNEPRDRFNNYDNFDDYELPPRSIFKKSSSETEDLPEWLEEKKEIINKTLKDFDIPGEVVKYTKGPTFTRYEILLESGVNVKKIANIFDTFQMNLGARTLRIQTPIPGKKTVGIEVPNDKPEMVCFGDILNDEFYDETEPLRVALGKDIDGNAMFTHIDKMPHGLVAGATNSGKSVCINTILISLLTKNKPDDLRLILIDPKTVELISYNDLPHLITPVITDPTIASESLKWACEEMERRFAHFAQNKARTIKDYNNKVKMNPSLEKMYYIVIVIDELADLMMVCSSDLEDSIKRITQKARAAGIHILLATQRPTVEFVKGSIKANIPTRIAFKVFSQTDSSTILDEGGAESLLGKGDMLIKEGDIPNRLQGAYISDEEIDNVTDFIRQQRNPNFLFSHNDLKKKQSQISSPDVSSNQESREMLYNVACYIFEQGNCSINTIGKDFNLGFNRAQRIVSILSSMGIVSEKNGTKAREILVTPDELERIFSEDE